MLLSVALAGCVTAPKTIPAIKTKPSGEIHSPRKKPVYGSESFVWPVRGDIISAFGSKVDRVTNKGIDIKAAEGTTVRAAKSGRVVYCDSYLRGFGKTIILDHGNNLQTAYSYNSDILVHTGDTVSQNDAIARVGRTGRAKTACLHFEVRKDGEVQNPEYYLTH